MENFSFYVKKTFGKKFRFHYNLDYKLKTLFLLSKFYKNILSKWTELFTTSPEILLNQFLWYNKYIQINNKTAYFEMFSLIL